MNLIEFHVGAKDVSKPAHDWVDTDFWDLFDPRAYDLVQTAKAGPPEYPYVHMPLPVIETLTLSAGIDRSPNIAWSVHISQWQRRAWVQSGGPLARSSVIPIPASPPATSGHLRNELRIGPDATVAGFHQRVDDLIHSNIPLEAFMHVKAPDRHFVIMGGGHRYRDQAAELEAANVHFLEHAGDATAVSRFLNTLDVFAHGRRDGETFGTVFAEAMAHGKPCLSHASFTGNNAQVETMGPAGFLANDVEEYAARLDELMRNEDLRVHLGAKAKAHASEYYAAVACATELAATYRQIVDRHDRPQRWVPYGWLESGFLCAGPVEDPASFTHHVAIGGRPHEFALSLLDALEPAIDRVIGYGDIGHLLCIAGARLGLKTEHIPCNDDQRNHADRSAVLNNLEGRMASIAPSSATFDDRTLVVVETGSLVPHNAVEGRAAVLVVGEGPWGGAPAYTSASFTRGGRSASNHRSAIHLYMDQSFSLPEGELSDHARRYRKQKSAERRAAAWSVASKLGRALINPRLARAYTKSCTRPPIEIGARADDHGWLAGRPSDEATSRVEG